MMYFVDHNAAQIGLACPLHADDKMRISGFYSGNFDRLVADFSDGQNFLTRAKPSPRIAQCKGAGGSIRVRENFSRCACVCSPTVGTAPVTRPLASARTRRPSLLLTPSETPKQESK